MRTIEIAAAVRPQVKGAHSSSQGRISTRIGRLVGPLALLALCLAGCAGLPEIPYDRSATEIKTIGLITPKFPDDAKIVLASTPGQSFGLIGALIDGAIETNHEARFKDVLASKSYSAKGRFQGAVIAGLTARGYTVVTIPVSRDETQFVSKYPTESGPPVDAYLDLVTTGYGYIAAGIRDSTPYRPVIAVRVRLVRAADSSVLMQDIVVYNPVGPATRSGAMKGAVTVAPDPQFQFTSFDSLEDNPDMATAGLDVAIQRTADAVCDLLK